MILKKNEISEIIFKNISILNLFKLCNRNKFFNFFNIQKQTKK